MARKILQVEIEADENYCGSRCKFCSGSNLCFLFGQDRQTANKRQQLLGQFLRLEICRTLDGEENT